MHLNICIFVLFATLSQVYSVAEDAKEAKCALKEGVTLKLLKELDEEIHIIARRPVLQNYFGCVLQFYAEGKRDVPLSEGCNYDELPASIARNRISLIESMFTNCAARKEHDCEISYKAVLCEIDYLVKEALNSK